MKSRKAKNSCWVFSSFKDVKVISSIVTITALQLALRLDQKIHKVSVITQ